MSLTTQAKHLSKCLYRSYRHFSSSVPSSSRSTRRGKTERAREADRKRHLIALYHKSENFITLDSLSSHIDAEFARYREDLVSSTRLEHRGYELADELEQWQHQPRYATRNAAANSASQGGLLLGEREKDSLQLVTDRQMRLRAALHGADESMKIGLEAVEEYARKTEGIHRAHGDSFSKDTQSQGLSS